MNTITSVKPYVGLKNTPQTTTPQTPQQPAFKGQLGKEVVKKVMNKEAVTVASVLAMMAGLIGFNKEKVSDVIEEFLNKIRGLQSEKDDLSKQLEQTRADASKKVEDAREIAVDNERRLIESYNTALKDKDNIINQKDAKIAELEKYQALAYVKSVNDLDIITPEQFLEILNEAKVAQPKAEASLLNYLFNGNGQEEFLAQMERSNKILKARQDKILDIPEMNKAFEDCKLGIGYDPYHVAQGMIKKVLVNNDIGARINYPPIRRQILLNADAITKPMINPTYYYHSNDKILEDVAEFYQKFEINKKELMNQGWTLEGKAINENNGFPYLSFSKNGEKMDIYLSDVAYHNFGFARITKADGTVLDYTNNNYWY